MTKIGKALRQALETYGISQTQLAVVMGLKLAVVNSWVIEKRTPSADRVV